jgi:molybdopterin synthase sulfur carrier subunit
MRDPTPSTVRVVYLARLREAFGSGGESFPLAGDATVATLLDALRARGGAFAAELQDGRAFRIAVNHVLAAPSDAVRNGDEVALLPPVTGG